MLKFLTVIGAALATGMATQNCKHPALLLTGYVVYRIVAFARSDCDVTLATSSLRPKNLSGRVIWVTGASSGIGEGIALELARYGTKLVLSARRTADLERVAAQCRERGSEAVVVPLDLIDDQSRTKAVAAAYAAFGGRVDVLVNNAGVSQRAICAEVDVSAERRLFEINYFATISLTKAVVMRMRQQQGGGHIAVVSSISGKIAAPVMGSYAASKHAVMGFFDTLRIEEAPNNIRVSTICPGPVVSEGAQNALRADGTPLGVQEGQNDGKMPTQRCAELVAVALSNGLEEVWITQQPVLTFTYVGQYLPTLYKRLAKKGGQQRVLAFKSGHTNIHNVKL
eukprot:PhM_4_TR17617/c0_g1_i1/m.40382/K11165/DHRS7; dehydrogenase/reductase SDR family member 7